MKQDLIDSVGAVRREVRACEREGKAARVVVAERSFDTTIDDVWNAITDPERIPRWFLPITGELRLGGRYQLEGNAGGEITACEPPTHLAVTWEFGGGVTWLDVHLSEAPDGGGAQLRLEHAALVDDVEHWNQFGPGAVGIGWDLTLLGLAEHLRTGETVAGDPEAVGAGPGGEVMIACGEAWYAADVASGTPEDVARGRTDRTIAAYMGTGSGDEAPEGEGAPEG
jgi:uncharacterized protein YndB with AHSA1/START domain